jgi:hypothetical protein
LTTADQPVASAIAAAIRLIDETGYSFDGREARSQPPLPELIYRVYHCRQKNWTGRDRSPFAVDRTFECALSAANCGTGSWDAGWTVVQVDSHGDIEIVKNGIRLWASPRELRVASARPGEVGSIAIGKEMRRTSFGYYLLFGDRNLPPDADVIRIYWSITATGATLLVRHLTERLNAIGLAFQFKVLNLPREFDRSDAAVLYLERGDMTAWGPVLADIYRLVRRHLRPETSMFARRIAPGAALAEDHGKAASFGREIARVCADGLVAARARGGHSIDDKSREIARCLADEGIDPVRPYLRPGSSDRYAPLDGLWD